MNFFLPQRLFSAITQNSIEKTFRILVKETSANFQVSLQKYVTPAAHYSCFKKILKRYII